MPEPAGQHDIAVYTPAGYDPDRRIPYPTIYVSHGLGGSEVQWFTDGTVANILDNPILRRQMQPAVLVATNWNGLPIIDGVQEEGHAQHLLNDVIPVVESRYYGIYSSSFAFGPTIDLSAPAARTRLGIHVGIGNQDPGPQRFVALERLATTDIPYVRTNVNGTHSWDVWRQLFTVFGRDIVFAHTTTDVKRGRSWVAAKVLRSSTGVARVSGRVVFSVDDTKIGSSKVRRHGRAVLPLSRKAAERLTGRTITATYSGDRFYSPSAGTTAPRPST